MMSLLKKLRRIVLLGLVSVIVGCASIPAGVERSPADPWEPFNRSVFEFNEGLDAYVLKPVVTGYRFVLPEFIRDGVYNFFSNYSDIYTALQNLLQGKPADAFTDLMRVVVNTTMGLGGLIDLATPGGLPKHKEDWGQTFGVWGVPSGPYVVLPFLDLVVCAIPLVRALIWSQTTYLSTSTISVYEIALPVYA